MISFFPKNNFAFYVMSTSVALSGVNRITTYPNEPPTIMHSPLQTMIGALANCEIYSITEQFKKKNIPIEKLQIDCKAKYDLDFFVGKKKQTDNEKNIFSDINIIIAIRAKGDKKKVSELLNTCRDICPIYNILKLSGIKINHETHFL